MHAAQRRLLVPGVQVGHVGVHSMRLLETQRLGARALADAAAAAGFSQPFLWRLLGELLRALGRLGRPGRYLLTHAPGSQHVCLFSALPDDPATAEVPHLPLALQAVQIVYQAFLPRNLQT